REELRVLSTRALREYIPKGKPVKGGPTAQKATVLGPGQYVDGMIPDSERWYAVDLRRGETLKASQAFIPPARLPEIIGAESSLDIVTPDFDIPARQNSSAYVSGLFDRRGYVDAQGVVSRPIGVGEQADPDEPFSKPGRYYLKVSLEDSDDKMLYDATGGRPYTSELAVEVLGRGKGEPPPKPQEEPERSGLPAASSTPEEPPSAALLAGVGGGLAALGFAGGAMALWRRRT
ncbi:MAG TPA: hypothetical protein VFG79_00200, partial [Solirubrobacter sp.]|nr:hypothetical protein [Solirubrobacter sp.]